MLSLIAAISQNRVIGNENQLLWHIPEDLRRFKALTLNHPVIMGRKTHESIGRALPKRANIVITRDQSYKVEGCIVTHSLEEAIKVAGSRIPPEAGRQAGMTEEEIFVIGGGQIYKQSINQADKLYLTVVHKDFSGDTLFPDYSRFNKIIAKKEGVHDHLTYTFLDLIPSNA